MSTYDNNVPLGNQTIAFTTDLIRGNFAFLNSSIGQEHNFDVTDPAKTYHLQASMPNQADPGALPTGTNGIYYVSGGVPKFYSSVAQYIQTSLGAQGSLSGTVSLNSGGFTNIVALPASSCGQYFLFQKAGVGTVSGRSASGTFVSDTNSIWLVDADSPGIILASTALTWRAELFSGGPLTFDYFVIYYTP